MGADGPTPPDGGIAEHARFFDHLVELVPPKYYYDEDFSRMNPRFLAKAARDALKADAKFKAKVAKRERLDPDKAATTLEVQRRKKAQGGQAGGAGAGAADDDAGAPSTSGRKAVAPEAGAAGAKGAAAGGKGAPGGAQDGQAADGLHLQLSGAALSRQELLERLHKKVEEARQRRKAADDTANKAREWRQKALEESAASKQKQQQQQAAKAGAKRKGGPGGDGEAGGEAAAAAQQNGGPQAGQRAQGQGPKKARREGQQAGGADESADFKFARIEVEEGGRERKHGKKAPKTALLKQAEATKAELEALAGTEEGKAKAQQVAWKAALARAAGEKVLDDPKLLRKSLKRESKRKEKHGKAWKERANAQQEAMAARQTKRNDNLAARRQKVLDNKKQKREKKLLRPGFEGRKEGFISGGGAKGAK